MVYELHIVTAALYLAASIAAAAGLGLRDERVLGGGVALLAVGAVIHAFAFFGLHTLTPTPSLTELALAASLMGWLAVVACLGLLLRVRGRALTALVAPAAFLGAFAGALWIRVRPGGSLELHPLVAHLHVVLASAGFALLGVAGAAGVLYLAHHRAIKRKRASAAQSALPSLESLDRVNTVALATGFTLLSLGVLSGMLWVAESEGRLWPGGAHANATLAVWVLYAVVAVLRFGGHESARRAALQSTVGFALLLVTVVGLRVLP